MLFGITDSGQVKGFKANRSMHDKIRQLVDSVINAMCPHVLEGVGTRNAYAIWWSMHICAVVGPICKKTEKMSQPLPHSLPPIVEQFIHSWKIYIVTIILHVKYPTLCVQTKLLATVM